MRPRPSIPRPSSSATPIVVVIVSLALIGGLAAYFLSNQEPTRVQSVAEKAEPAAPPAVEADPEMKTGARRVRTSTWEFEGSEAGKKLVGKITFESDDKEEVLRGDTTLSDVRYKLFSPSGEKLKVGYLPFRDLKSGESSPTEITYGAWKRVKRVWLEKTLREATKEK
jgi:hypothetical protein